MTSIDRGQGSPRPHRSPLKGRITLDYLEEDLAIAALGSALVVGLELFSTIHIL